LKFVFFTDRDLGKRFPEILANTGLSVERHDDVFPPDCPDETWLDVGAPAGCACRWLRSAVVSAAKIALQRVVPRPPPSGSLDLGLQEHALALKRETRAARGDRSIEILILDRSTALSPRLG
jgi:hypothetical protein